MDRPCSQYFTVLALYDARSTIVHEGKLGLSADQEDSATWFIAAQLPHRVLTWFARHPDADLTELDTQIAALRSASTNLGTVQTGSKHHPRGRSAAAARRDRARYDLNEETGIKGF